MPDLSERLGRLVSAATVQIHAPKTDTTERTRLWGTGFFVAPGWILTCAHVVRTHLDASRKGRFGVTGAAVGASSPAEARLEQMLWRGGEGEIPFEQDLALLRLADDESAEQHPCVWFADWAGRTLGDERFVHGYYLDESRRVRTRDALAKVSVADGAARRFEPTVQFKSGLSGSPVVAPDSGAVVGVMKTRQEGYGGAAIDITALRGFGELYAEIAAAHDLWHHARLGRSDSWVALQDEAAGGPGGSIATDAWTPGDRAEALRHLALLRRAIPSSAESEKPGDIGVLVRIAMGRRWLSDSRPVPRSWRDGHGELYDGAKPLEAEVFLRYLRRVIEYAESDGLDTGPLAAWLDEREELLPGRQRAAGPWNTEPPAHLHGVGNGAPFGEPGPARPDPDTHPVHARAAETEEPVAYPHPGSERSVVVLEIEEVSGEDHRFYWTVRLDHVGEDEEMLAGREDGPGVPYRDLVHEVGEALNHAFERVDLGGSPAPLEVALPYEHFDEPVHQWQLNHTVPLHQDPAKEPLGVHRPVVVRSLARLREPDPERDARHAARWRDLHAAERISSLRLPPAGRSLRGAIERTAPGEVPAMCRSAGEKTGEDVLAEVLGQGHGAALWHGTGHAGSQCGEACAALHEEIDGVFRAGRRADRLAYSVWQLRRDIAHHDNGPHPVSGLVLLYDRPLDATDVLDAPA
ncbi:VMAP-C domain-containing protein [Streptomyces luteolus]|uniref:Trypsin-like peptidase domain-containing protein n=1 Tax=Streptomyces luteolus TaxID=3043615 RepID=A0ABT6SPV6_9ACTN|nr:trypsin-like peptidase domain-containing protein [Streptomyces sp. B-S-A12]MDI3417128.1 trypsin-like peptidase domain-containing protein [Streptomyces sp. B-S-A12]